MSDADQDLMPHRRHLGLIVVLLAITLVTGAIHGRLTQRWGPRPDLLATASHLESFPQEFGDWQLLKKEPIDDSTVQMLSCAGYVNRQYVNRKTGENISLAIMLGPSGPISVHTPEVCYSSRAYSIRDARKPVSISDSDGHNHSFWNISFRANTPSTEELRVYYAWYGKRGWEASKWPRFEFAGRPLLFKLQIASLGPAVLRDQEDACAKFLTAMLRSGWSVNG
jgi:hypothetical protein